MTDIQCPSCGAPIQVPENKPASWWKVGCLLAVLAVAFVVAVIGFLAAIAVPSFVRAHERSQRNACFKNIRGIDSAKENAVYRNRYKEGDTVSEQEISKYIRPAFSNLVCPKGGVYTINPIGQPAECSVHGLPDPPHNCRETK